VAKFDEFLRVSNTSKLHADAGAEAQEHIEDCKAKLSDEERSQVLAPQSVCDSLANSFGGGGRRRRDTWSTIEEWP